MTEFGVNTDNSEMKETTKLDCTSLLLFLSQVESNKNDEHEDRNNRKSPPTIQITQLGPYRESSKMEKRNKDDYFYDDNDFCETEDEEDDSSSNIDSTNLYFVIARTDSICCCQILGWDSSNNKVIRTDPTVVWKNSGVDTFSDPSIVHTDDEREIYDNYDAQYEVNDTEFIEYITCSDIIPFPSEPASSKVFPILTDVCVALGTNKSRVLAFNIQICTLDHDIESIETIVSKSYYEPLPFILPKPSSHTDLATFDENDNISGKHIHKKINNRTKKEEKEDDPFFTFHPKGGVSSIYSFRNYDNTPSVSQIFVWVSYNNGTAIQLSDLDFFPSHIDKVTSKATKTTDLNYLRNRISIPIPQLSQVLPLPCSHNSILAPVPNKELTLSTNAVHALSYGGDNKYNNSHDPTKGGASLTFYSSESHASRDAPKNDSDSELVGIIGGYVLDGTKALVSSVSNMTSSVIGSALQLRWKKSNESDAQITENASPSRNRLRTSHIEPNHDHPNKSFLTGSPPLHVPQTTNILDPPRRITSVSVDPTGKLLAMTDSLGRVTLMDLVSKQIIRMWKGLRDANCYWIQEQLELSVGSNPNDKKRQQVVLYLVLHGKQRNIVEIWRMKHGGRVKVFDIAENSRILECWTNTIEENCERALKKCFILHTTSNGHLIEPLLIEDKSISSSRTSSSNTSNTKDAQSHNMNITASVGNSHDLKNTSIHLKLFQQLLSSDTQIAPNPDSVFTALTQISSLEDLSKALDLLSVATSIEDEMEVDGSLFLSKAIDHCDTVLKKMEEEEGNKGITHENIYAIQLAQKIKYLSLVFNAYDTLHHYEAGLQADTRDMKDEEDINYLAPRTSWAIEAIKWVETYNKVNQILENTLVSRWKPNILRFSDFAKACTMTKSNDTDDLIVDFCDSSKDRIIALKHVFHPFLQDIFVYNVVNSIFTSMGLNTEIDRLQQYFGEWFLTLPAKESAKASLFGTWCPILRWLQEIVVKSISADESSDTPYLNVLLKTCMTCDDLPKAFLLAAVCREAIWLTAKQQEEKTYGKISSSEAVIPWDNALRKLRICLLISLRLNTVNVGQFSINPANIDAGDIFSVYEWLARDELLLSHKQEEIASIELECRKSINALNPFDPECDAPTKWKLLQNECVQCAQKNLGLARSPRKSHGYEKELEPLLLYLRNHLHPQYLAAHRALILCSKWGQKADSLHLLKDAVNALRFLKNCGESYTSISLVVCIEIWQVYIRPVFRALLFDFEDVHELSENVWTPLCMDVNWLRSFSKVAIEILGFIANIHNTIQDIEEFETVSILSKDEGSFDHDKNMWPEVQKDIILENLLSRSQKIVIQSINEHRLVIGVLQFVADDLSILDFCVPEESEIFLQSSLFMDSQNLCYEPVDRIMFLNEVMLKKASECSDNIIDYLDLGELAILSDTWDMSLKDVRSRYLLALCAVGKDACIVDLTASNYQYIDIGLFVNGAFNIICRRLDFTIEKLKKSKQLRSLIGILDADTCEWVKASAKQVDSDDGLKSIKRATRVEGSSLPTTHDLVLKTLQMSSTIGSSGYIKQAHSLSILTGSLMKEMEEMSQKQ